MLQQVITWTAAMRPVEDRRERVRVIASFAEYLDDDAPDRPDQAPETIEPLGEWRDGDPQLLAQARAHVLRDASCHLERADRPRSEQCQRRRALGARRAGVVTKIQRRSICGLTRAARQ